MWIPLASGPDYQKPLFGFDVTCHAKRLAELVMSCQRDVCQLSTSQVGTEGAKMNTVWMETVEPADTDGVDEDDVSRDFLQPLHRSLHHLPNLNFI